MARKDVLVTQIGPNGAGPKATPFSLATSFTAPPTIVKFLDNCSYQINVSTTNSTGTFAVQVSNDYSVYEPSGEVMNAGNWISLTLAGGTPSVNATPDLIVINLNQLPFYAIRLAYTANVAGTGTATIYIVDKQIGG